MYDPIQVISIVLQGASVALTLGSSGIYWPHRMTHTHVSYTLTHTYIMTLMLACIMGCLSFLLPFLV